MASAQSNWNVTPAPVPKDMLGNINGVTMTAINACKLRVRAGLGDRRRPVSMTLQHKPASSRNGTLQTMASSGALQR